MGQDNKKIIVNALNKWRAIILEESQALSKGNFDGIERFTKQSALIQEHLDDLLSKTDISLLGKDILRMMKEISDMESVLIIELQKGTDELSERLANLRKNKLSVKGYKQITPIPPRFTSGKT